MMHNLRVHGMRYDFNINGVDLISGAVHMTNEDMHAWVTKTLRTNMGNVTVVVTNTDTDDRWEYIVTSPEEEIKINKL